MAFQALHQYVKELGQLPRPYNREDAARFVEIAKAINDKAASKVCTVCVVRVKAASKVCTVCIVRVKGVNS